VGVGNSAIDITSRLVSEQKLRRRQHHLPCQLQAAV